ncbi:CcdB family protein [Sphingomonas sp. SUN039]|uniref:CcdB family protein n=1 Tax=Sphingomonas sp. SUN039 TaxID=2937787 RepID=UPI00216442CA|nr:CcdB family protein [Sphingomonas sp. SUN039]UVO55095.1 CcdB family protein [Sphingomonas sp. SUN039]
MARYDVFRDPDGTGFVVDVQSDIFDDYRTRVVIPLLPPEIAPLAVPRLNPRFDIEGQSFTLHPHFVASVPSSALGRPITSLASEDYAIAGALDLMLKGF